MGGCDDFIIFIFIVLLLCMYVFRRDICMEICLVNGIRLKGVMSFTGYAMGCVMVE